MPRSLLFCFAHPDDESFVVAGVACKYVEEGVRLALATATLGEAGKCGDPPICSPEDLPAVRERELRSAAALLGVVDVVLLGYKDRELASAPPAEIRQKLVGVIRTQRPQVVVTFDPNGSNAHPDHIAISRFTSDAVAAAADPRWFPETGEAHSVQRLVWTPPSRPWLFARSQNLAAEAGVDFAIDIRRWTDRKAEALRVHRTQHLNTERVFFNQPDAQKLLGLETFRQAFGPPLRTRPLDDLFEGVRVED